MPTDDGRLLAHSPPLPQTAAVPPGACKLACFEAIRGLAALAVAVGHFILGFWPGLYFCKGLRWDHLPPAVRLFAKFPGNHLWDGHMAVSLFFVLSGFVLSLAGFRRGAPALGLAAARRYPRLAIPVAASVLLAFALLGTGAMRGADAVRFMNDADGLPHGVHSGTRPWNSHGWLAIFYGSTPKVSVALREAAWGAFVGTSFYDPPLWTMRYELIGSFLVFGFVGLFGRLRNRWLLYAACGALLIVTAHYYLLDFLLGVALCDLWEHNQRTWRYALPPLPALALAGAGLLLVPWKPLAALLVIGATAAAPRLQQALSGRGLVFLGRVSFGLYLIHMPLFCSLGCGLYLAFCRGLGWSHVAGSLLAMLITLLATLLAAWVFTEVVDRPTVALTHRLDAWLRPESPPDETAAPALPDPSPARAA